MKNNKIQKTSNLEVVKSKTPTYITLGVVFMTLWATGFHPVFLLFFSIIGFFIYKAFEKPESWEAKYIFDFYISANEILRDSDRRWYGFEIQETIHQGERILQRMPDPPPLLHFALGALYNKIGSHKAALEHLTGLFEDDTIDELNCSVPSPELRNYVKALRRIESEPTEAPKSSAAVRALERARRNRLETILEESRKALWDLEAKRQAELEAKKEENLLKTVIENVRQQVQEEKQETVLTDEKPLGMIGEISSIVVSQVDRIINENKETPTKNDKKTKQFKPRQSISEVLQDIYDRK